MIFLPLQIRCTAQAKHTLVGTATDRLSSKAIFTGLEVVSPDVLTLVEGGEEEVIRVRSTVPLSCQGQGHGGRAKGRNCCIEIQLEVRERVRWYLLKY